MLWMGDDIHLEAAQRQFAKADVINWKRVTRKRRTVPPAAATFASAGFWQTDEYLRAKDHALKLMQREDHEDSFHSLEREAYFHELVFWAADRVSNLRPDAVIMAEAPHSASQYVLYAVAEAMGVPIFCFVSWPFVPGLVLRRGLSGGFIPLSGEDVRRSDYLDACISEVKRYLDSFSDQEGYGFLPRYMQLQANRENKDSNSQLKKIPQILRKVSLWSKLLVPRRAQAALKRNRLKKEIHKGKVELPKGQYVYFPLHYEPERTTTPDGGIFHDQLRALALLRALVPAGIAIVTKEHPSTFYSFMNGHLGRHPRFYAAIRRMAGVYLLPSEVSSAELLRGSMAVATITGTVAVEGVAMGKHVLAFGNPWYRGCPGIAEYHPNLNWDAFLSAPVPTRDELQDWFLQCLKQYLLPGTVNPSNERYFGDWYQGGLVSDSEVPVIAAALRAVLCASRDAFLVKERNMIEELPLPKLASLCT